MQRRINWHVLKIIYKEMVFISLLGYSVFSVHSGKSNQNNWTIKL